MERRRLTEEQIQKRTAAWLHEHYTAREDVVAVAGPILEAHVHRKERGNVRAGGLLAAKLAAKLAAEALLNVALEAKSFKAHA